MLRVFTPLVSVEEDMPLCNLGHLFNAYAARLSGLEVQAVPGETLREYHRLTVGPLKNLSKPDQVRARSIKAAQDRLYVLALLDNTLHDMHNCVLAACNILSDLFNLYDGDLHRFAVRERLRIIAEYVPGTDEEMRAYSTPEDYAEFVADWEPTEPGQPYRVKYKDDEASLAPYTVKAQLAPFFASLHECPHVDRIGSATPEDFAYFTEAVAAYSAGHKTGHLGPELGVYRLNHATGEHEKQTYAQRIENEVNDARTDVQVAEYFKQILRRMHFVDGLALMLTHADSYRELLTELVAIRDCTDLHEPAILA
jgi:hypothetical protein